MGKISDFNYNEKVKEELTDKYQTYKDMNKEELNSELLKQVNKQKSDGTFDYEKLENMVNALQGTLPQENFENIKRILQSLK